MKIPKTFQMGGHTVLVSYNAELVCRGRMGECYRDQHKIYISNDVPESQQHETLIHEIVEFTNHLYELELSHQAIQALGVGIHQALSTFKGVLK